MPVRAVLLWVVAGAVRQVVFFLGMAANRVADHFTALHGQPGRSPTAATR